MYEAEKKELLGCLPDAAVKRINHIGSSAVEGLIGKPTVDILLEIEQDAVIGTIEQLLAENGWTLMSSSEKPFISRSFNKGYTPEGFAEKVYHLHVRYYGDWDELYFRDYLAAHSQETRRYAKLKLSLLEEFKKDRDGYTQAKTQFIKLATKKAREEFGGRYKPKD